MLKKNLIFANSNKTDAPFKDFSDVWKLILIKKKTFLKNRYNYLLLILIIIIKILNNFKSNEFKNKWIKH